MYRLAIVPVASAGFKESPNTIAPEADTGQVAGPCKVILLPPPAGAPLMVSIGSMLRKPIIVMVRPPAIFGSNWIVSWLFGPQPGLLAERRELRVLSTPHNA